MLKLSVQGTRSGDAPVVTSPRADREVRDWVRWCQCDDNPRSVEATSDLRLVKEAPLCRAVSCVLEFCLYGRLRAISLVILSPACALGATGPARVFESLDFR